MVLFRAVTHPVGKLTKNNIGPKIVLYLYLPGSCLLYAEVLAHHIVEVVQKERWRAQIWNLKIIQIQIQI